MKGCALLFPGQGAQYPGMGQDLVSRFPQCREILERAEAHLKMPLGDLMFFGPKEKLDKDLTAQIAVYTVSCMVADVLKAYGIQTGAIVPYSSGLYAACYAAGVVDFETGLTLMQAADECIRKENIQGSMGVVLGLSVTEVEGLCARVQGIVEASIVNTRHQIIVSGETSALDILLQLAIEAGALKTDRLSASAPYHCSLLESADRCLHRAVADTAIHPPMSPIISYIDCRPLVNAPQIAMFLSNQLANSVEWVDVIEEMIRCGFMPMVEVGPGQMLSRSVRWIHRQAKVLHTEAAGALVRTIEALGNESQD